MELIKHIKAQYPLPFRFSELACRLLNIRAKAQSNFALYPSHECDSKGYSLEHRLDKKTNLNNSQ